MKNTKQLLFSALLLNSIIGKSQETASEKKHQIYFLWGYNREVYTKSNIRFQNNGDPNRNDQYGQYDFTLEKAKGVDKPDFDQLGDVVNFTIPQYNFRIGWYFANKPNQGIEINYDHTKYVVYDGQTLRIKGTINGKSYNQDTLMVRNQMHFEHTDGANFWMVMYIRKFKLHGSQNGKHHLFMVGKVGGGPVIPRTDVTLFGNRLNNRFHLAGYCTGLSAAFRAELWKHFTIELEAKTGHAHYLNALVQGKGNGKASHYFGYLEGIFCVGYTFGATQKN